MSSGFGLNGGRSRCFEFWQEFAKCHSTSDEPGQCSAQVEDYFECLHRTKEVGSRLSHSTERHTDHACPSPIVYFSTTSPLAFIAPQQHRFHSPYTALRPVLPACHFRQIKRAKEIKAHFLQKQAQETKDKRALAEKRANGVIVSLGLVNADEGGGEEK